MPDCQSDRFLLLIVAGILLIVSPASAHNVVDTPDLGKLITTAELIVRGAITAETRAENGARVATVKVDKVLKGNTSEKEIVFESDPDHGVRYRRGEQALIFLNRLPPGSELRYASPQIFQTKYTITSFDPSGYDGLVGGLLELSKVPDASDRQRRLKRLMTQQLESHEREVRLYAAHVLRASGLRTEN